MARIDIPQLQCDRCKTDTTDIQEMARYQKLTYYHMSGSENWDLCPKCWGLFRLFVENSGRLTFIMDDRPEVVPNVGVIRTLRFDERIESEKEWDQRYKDGLAKNEAKE